MSVVYAAKGPYLPNLERAGRWLKFPAICFLCIVWFGAATATAQPEYLFRGIEDKTGEPLRFAVQIDD